MPLSLEIIWFDDDAILVRARSDNGQFAGSADCYAAHSVFADIAAAVHGFPVSCDDRRQFALGAQTPDFGCGGLQLRLWCVDSSGHAVADIRIRSSRNTSVSGQEEIAEFSFPVEAAAIDEFVATLRGMRVAIGAAVTLRQAT